MQKELALTDPAYAQLLGKNIATIRNWKTMKGVLNLQQVSYDILQKHIDKYNGRG